MGKPGLWGRSLLFSRADVWRVRLYVSQDRAARHQPLLPTLPLLRPRCRAHADPDLSCLYERVAWMQQVFHVLGSCGRTAALLGTVNTTHWSVLFLWLLGKVSAGRKDRKG